MRWVVKLLQLLDQALKRSIIRIKLTVLWRMVILREAGVASGWILVFSWAAPSRWAGRIRLNRRWLVLGRNPLLSFCNLIQLKCVKLVRELEWHQSVLLHYLFRLKRSKVKWPLVPNHAMLLLSDFGTANVFNLIYSVDIVAVRHGLTVVPGFIWLHYLMLILLALKPC